MNNIVAKDILVDAVALSERLCVYPIQCKLAYATKENFLGRLVKGYNSDALKVCLVTPRVAKQLCGVQNDLIKKDLSLFVFDALRPLRAVKDFATWFYQPPINKYELERKALHYPHLNKQDLSNVGYVAEDVSRHCFGNTVDITIHCLKTNQLLNMGTIFDYLDEDSHIDTSAEIIGKEAYNNRQFLFKIMKQFDFTSYPLEYWHFEYIESEVDAPIDIEINSSLVGLNINNIKK